MTCSWRVERVNHFKRTLLGHISRAQGVESPRRHSSRFTLVSLMPNETKARQCQRSLNEIFISSSQDADTSREKHPFARILLSK